MAGEPNTPASLHELLTQSRAHLAALEALEGALHREREQAQAKTSALEAEHQQTREAHAATTARLEKAVSELASSQDALRAAQERAGRLDEELIRSKAGFEADLAGLRDRLNVTQRDLDALQAAQLEWAADRERLLEGARAAEARTVEAARESDRVRQAIEAERDEARVALTAIQGEHAHLKSRHEELSQQSEKLAGEWSARRQALASEIALQNQEMEQVRASLKAAQERERDLENRLATAGQSGGAGLTPEQRHAIASRLNTVMGFSTLLLEERASTLTADERREFLKYLQEGTRHLAELLGDRGGVSLRSTPVRTTPAVLVADGDTETRARIEPLISRAGYETTFVVRADDALKEVLAVQPLAILVDLELPPQGAAPFVAALRRDPRTRDIAIVVMHKAGKAPGGALSQCESLAKPIDRQQLLQMLVKFDLVADGKRSQKMPSSVLLIDDDPHQAILMKALLKPFNIQLLHANGGRAGVELARKQKPDLVVLDLLMAEGDGFEAVAALRAEKDASQLPILVYTAKGLTREDRTRLEGQVQSILPKSEFSHDRFLELVFKRGERRNRGGRGGASSQAA